MFGASPRLRVHPRWLALDEVPRAVQETGSVQYLRVQHVTSNSAQHEQTVFLHRPGDTQARHSLQGALVSFIVVAEFFAFFYRILF